MPEPAQQAPPHRSRTGHRLLRWFAACIALLVVVLIIVQIVLSTAIPKEIVIAQLQRIMGLRITAAEVSTGWFGHTTLRDVTVSLPLAEHAFLEMPELRVTHTWLPTLLVTQSIDIDAIALEHPRIQVTQDRQGRWNLQDVAQLLARIGGTGQSPSNQKSSPLVLPQVDLRDGEIDITDNAGRQANLFPLNMIGQPINALVWRYDASCDNDAGTHIKLVGRVAPNDSFSHEVDFALSGLTPLAKPWIPGFDPAATANGTWRGAQTAMESPADCIWITSRTKAHPPMEISTSPPAPLAPPPTSPASPSNRGKPGSTH